MSCYMSILNVCSAHIQCRSSSGVARSNSWLLVSSAVVCCRMQCSLLRLTIIMLSGRSVKRTTTLNSLLWWRKSFQLQNPKGLESRIHQRLCILLHHLSLVRKQIAAPLAPNPECFTSSTLSCRGGGISSSCDWGILETGVTWNHSETVTYWYVFELSFGPETRFHLLLFPWMRAV